MTKNYASLLIQAYNLSYSIIFWFNLQDKKQFAQTILPALRAHDAILVNRLGEWETRLPSKS